LLKLLLIEKLFVIKLIVKANEIKGYYLSHLTLAQTKDQNAKFQFYIYIGFNLL